MRLCRREREDERNSVHSSCSIEADLPNLPMSMPVSLSPLKRAEAELTKLNDSIFGDSAKAAHGGAPESTVAGGVPPAPGSDYEGQRLRAAAAPPPPPTKGAWLRGTGTIELPGHTLTALPRSPDSFAHPPRRRIGAGDPSSGRLAQRPREPGGREPESEPPPLEQGGGAASTVDGGLAHTAAHMRPPCTPCTTAPEARRLRAARRAHEGAETAPLSGPSRDGSRLHSSRRG